MSITTVGHHVSDAVVFDQKEC